MTLCPVSHEPCFLPLKNPECHHIIDFFSLLAWFEKTPELTCPLCRNACPFELYVPLEPAPSFHWAPCFDTLNALISDGRLVRAQAWLNQYEGPEKAVYEILCQRSLTTDQKYQAIQTLHATNGAACWWLSQHHPKHEAQDPDRLRFLIQGAKLGDGDCFYSLLVYIEEEWQCCLPLLYEIIQEVRDVRYRLGYYWKTRNPELALIYFEKSTPCPDQSYQLGFLWLPICTQQATFYWTQYPNHGPSLFALYQHIEKRRDWLEQAAHQNHPEACFLLGEWGETPEQRAWLTKAGPNHLPAQSRLGYWHLVQKDYETARTYFKASINQMLSQEGLAQIYVKADHDWHRAWKYMKAHQQRTSMQLLWGLYYLERQDVTWMNYWYSLAARDTCEAMLQLAYHLIKPFTLCPIKSLSELDEIIQGDETQGWHYLLKAKTYLTGYIAFDDGAIWAYSLEAAKKGHPQACYEVGQQLFKDNEEGTRLNQEFIHWWTLAANQNFEPGIKALTDYYVQDRNFETARFWAQHYNNPLLMQQVERKSSLRA